MRYRALAPDGDYTFGRGVGNFLIDTPATVGQLVLTTLRLWQGEWYINTTAGTPWIQQVLGAGTKPLYDMVIRSVVLAVPGVTSIENYESAQDPSTRQLAVSMTINTIWGKATVATTIGGSLPASGSA